MTTTRSRFRQALVTLVALTVALSAFGYAPVGTAAAQSVSVSNSPSTTTAAPGDTVTITTTFTATDVNGPGLEAQFPSGWTGEMTDSDSGFVKEAGGNVLQAVWLSNGTYEVTYDVEIPADADAGDYSVTTEGSGINPANDERIAESTTTTITVQTTPDNQDPSASFSASPSDPTVGDSVSFDASGSSDADGSIASYEWDFGDGTSATGASPSHSYDSAGSYTVSLTVTDDDGATATTQQTITVSEAAPENQAPSASFSASPSDPAVGDSVSFDASGSSDADGSIASYEWDFGDGSTDSGDSVTHTFSSPGDYDVELTVTDDDGATDTTTQTVSVAETAAPANFQISAIDVESPVTQGDAATVSASVENTGDDGTQTVAVAVDGATVDSQGVTLASGASDDVTFEVATDSLSVGDHDVDLSTANDSASGQLTVTEPEPPADDLETSVSLSPANGESSVGGTTTYELVVDDAEGGVGAYTATVSVDDPSVGSITDVELQGNPAEETSEANIAADGSSVAIDAALMNTADSGSVVVATITVQGEAAGSTSLSTAVEAIADEDATTYAVTGTNGASLTVTEITVGNYTSPVTDVDDDGAYEDINGDGEFNIVDIQGLFVNLDDEAVQDNPAYFDFNGDGTVDVADVQALFNELTT
ncbi:PKD domain-containing protein [Halobellus sp. H-GB7]|uniref:PKD domain-containing protein n=1 Tax=Halobellus sp. H-GB7 TaxID=3069756 RepID=UPI0027B1E279|nr:PKD domain-containing protein [Halobellus sp. H-GB7]MDQ2054593.1 PKD domain-containing protein [Halobellus sp. H-GB7]